MGIMFWFTWIICIASFLGTSLMDRAGDVHQSIEDDHKLPSGYVKIAIEHGP